MATDPRLHRCYRGLNRPLTILGVDRRIFGVAVTVAAIVFYFFHTLLGGVSAFAIFIVAAQRASRNDPELLRIVLDSARFRTFYSPARYEGFQLVQVEGGHRDD